MALLRDGWRGRLPLKRYLMQYLEVLRNMADRKYNFNEFEKISMKGYVKFCQDVFRIIAFIIIILLKLISHQLNYEFDLLFYIHSKHLLIMTFRPLFLKVSVQIIHYSYRQLLTIILFSTGIEQSNKTKTTNEQFIFC